MICDYNNYRYVGWKGTIASSKGTGPIAYNELFTSQNIETISNKVTELLQGLDSEGRQLSVSDQKNMLSNFFNRFGISKSYDRKRNWKVFNSNQC